MRTKFIVFFFVLSLASCNCGLLNWFNKWSDELEMKNDPKCRERREAAEQGIIPEIVESSSGKKVSLLDIEEGQSTSGTQNVAANHGQRKLKRCPILGLTKPIGNSILGAASPLTLSKRGADNIRAQYEQQCNLCRNQLSCKIFGKCDDCTKYCKHDQTFTNDPTTSPSESFLSSRMTEMKDNTISKTPYYVASFADEQTKKTICEIVGIKNVNDIERVAIWVTTISNNPPRKSQMGGQTGTLVTNGPNLKTRFNDYDSGEESQVTNMRNFSEDEKLNPSLIEGPPPFLKSSQNTENLPTLESQSMNNPLIGSTNKEIIVQPKEFQSDESDEISTNKLKPTVFERLTTPRAISLQKLSADAPKPKSGFIQNLLRTRQKNLEASANTFRPTPTPVVAEIQPKILADENSTPSNSHLSDINEALQEVKAMVKNIHEEAQKASEKRLLGSTHLHQDSPSNLIPPQALDHIKDVNKYLINRAQDALDTVKHPEDNGETVGSARDDHSDTTKRVINDLKKMPEFLLTKFKDTLNGFGTASPITTAPVEKDQTTLQQRFSDDDVIVSLTERPELETTKSYKNKLEKYLAQLKEQRQNKYNPEKFIKPAPASRIYIPNTEAPTDVVGTPEEKPTPMSKLEEDLKKRKELLKNRLKSFNEKINKPTTMNNAETLLEDSNPTTQSLLDENLKNNQASTQKTLLESRSNTNIEESKKLLKEKMQKYVNSLKSPVKVPNTENQDDRLKSVFKAAADNSQQDKLKQKIRDYVASLKTPLTNHQNQPVDNLEQPQLLGETAPTPNDNSPTLTDEQIPLMQDRSNFHTDNNNNNLGKIVQTSSNPQDIFYVGYNVKVPMKINKHQNGTLELTVDLDKLCSCQNSTCNKNHSNIEETVGTILEKEAELEMQLDSSSPVQVNQGLLGGFNKQRSGIFKRSPDFRPEFTTLKNVFNNLNTGLPVSPRLQEAASDLNTIKTNLQNSFRKLETEAEKVRLNNLNSITTGSSKNLRNFDLTSLGKLNEDYIRQLEREKTLQKLRLQKNVPNLPQIQNRFSNKINNDLVRLAEPYQQTQINALKNKLKNVENEVKKYEDKNGKMLADEAKAVFDIRKDDVVQQEVNLVNKVLSWINNLSKPDKKK